jgi:hypothetical protein
MHLPADTLRALPGALSITRSQRALGDGIGVYLDTKGEQAVDWQEIAAIIEEAYPLRAPKALVAQLDEDRQLG